MLPVSDGFLATLAGSHRTSVQARVRKGTGPQVSVPILGGQVTLDATSPVRRRLALTVPPRIPTGHYTDVPALPRDPGDLLAAFGQEITVTWGLVYADGTTEWLPVGVFRVDGSAGTLRDDQPVTIQGVSREAWVIDDEFVAPRTLSSPSAQSLIGQLIHETLPSVEVVVSATRDARVPTFTTTTDRWGTITMLAESIGAVVYADASGRFVVADAPRTDGTPVWTVRAGAGGVLVSASTSTSREGVYNAVVVRGESPSGDFAPLQGVVYDDDPTSPTRYGDPHDGAWGRRPRFETYPNVADLTQAHAIGRGLLAQSTGAAQMLDASSVPNPALEGGDLIHVIPDELDPAGTVRAHVVDGWTLDLVAGGAFPIRTRDVRQVTT